MHRVSTLAPPSPPAAPVPTAGIRADRQSRFVDAVWTIGFAGVLGIVLPLSMLGDPTSPLRSSNHALVFLLCIFSAGRLGALLGGARRQYLSVTFYLFVYVWFGLAAIVQLDADYFYAPEHFLGRGFDQPTRLMATAIIWVGVLAYELGLRLGRRQWHRGPARRQLRPLRVQVLSVASLMSSTVALVIGGAAAVLFTTREQFYATFGTRAEGGYSTLLSELALRLPIFVAAILLVYLYRQPGGLRWARATVARRVLIITTVVAALMINNIASSARAVAGALAFALLFAWLRPNQKLVRRLAFVAILVSVLFLYPLANNFRRSHHVAGVPSEQPTSLRDELIYSSGFGMFGQVHTAAEYVDLRGHSFGRQLLGSALFLVPRTVWTDKPVDTGDMMHDALGYPPQLNESSPLWAEFYVDGGFPLVVIGFAALGAVSARLQRRFDEDAPFSFAAVLVPLLAGYQLYILRGSLLAVTPRLTVLIALVFVTTSSHPDDTRPRCTDPRTRRVSTPAGPRVLVVSSVTHGHRSFAAALGRRARSSGHELRPCPR